MKQYLTTKYQVVYALKSSGSVSTLQKYIDTFIYSIFVIHVYHVLSEMARKTTNLGKLPKLC